MSPHTPSALQVNLHRLRIQREWDRTELARKAGVSLPYVSQLLSGAKTNPRITVLRKLATALGTTVAELTGEVDTDETPEDAEDLNRVPAAS
ncbi:helix-turn-helix domain-containing protein [Lentzea sp. NPDC102401]|uniref:helix-turn-helix domain-containing protein n=1 Tax=Lentzea sp. NPDC102401 TaxID=3364128 RepID=UPI00380005DA